MSETAVLEPQTELAKVEPVAGTELATIDLTNPLELFKPNGCDPLIEMIRAQVEEAKKTRDPSSEKGQREMRSKDRKIAMAKNDIDRCRKTFLGEMKEKIRVCDKEGARVWDAIEAMQTDYMQPLKEWEESEKTRKAAHEEAIRDMQFAAAVQPSFSSEDIQRALGRVDELYARDWQEFALKAKAAYAEYSQRLNAQILEAVERERLAALAHQQRIADDLRRKKEREDKIKAQATKDAEAKAKKDADELAAKVLADKMAAEAETRRIEKERADAVQRAKDLEALKEKVRVDGHQLILGTIAEIKGTGIRILSTQECNARIERLETFKDRNWEEFVERGENAYKGAVNHLKDCRDVAGERERQEAEDARLESERLAQERAQAAVEAERAKVARDQENARKANELREQNKRHRATINKKVQSAITAIIREIPADSMLTSDDIAEAIQKAIEEGKIPSTRITY